MDCDRTKTVYCASYRQALERLSEVLASAPFLNGIENPVLMHLRRHSASLPAARHAIEQYCFLPATIVEYLSAGLQRLAGWPGATSELLKNRAEEMGSRTSGISHYDLLRSRLSSELNIDLSQTKSTPSTTAFIADLRRNLREGTPEFAAGMIYALESSAVKELLVVADLLNEYTHRANLPNACNVPAILASGPHFDTEVNFDPRSLNLSEFIRIHVADFEVGHETHLADALEPYVTTSRSLAEFETGFLRVMTAMSYWWSGITEELAVFGDSCTFVDAPHLRTNELASR